MRKLLAITIALLIPSAVCAQRRVRGYTRRDGRQVQPYERSPANAYRWDNHDYAPSQPAYNPSYFQPTRNYDPSYRTPSPSRFTDNNPNNDFAPAQAPQFVPQRGLFGD